MEEVITVSGNKHNTDKILILKKYLNEHKYGHNMQLCFLRSIEF